ncbi:MAG: ISKra4 family transposase [Chloroflexota bacterium]
MDRAELSEAIVRELGELFVRELTQVGPALVAADLDGIERGLQEVSRRVLGRVVEAVVTTIGAGQAVERPSCGSCQQPLRAVDPARPRALQGLVGDYRVRRAYVVCDRCGRGIAPLDERLGLGPGALSPGLARVACRVGIEAGFGTAADLLHETLRVDVATEAVRRVTEGIGAVAEAEQQVMIAQAQAGQAPPADVEPAPAALVVEVDGVHVHAGGDWHELKVGLVAPLGPATRTVTETGRVALALGRQSACAGFETAARFWYRVYVAACQRGLGGPELALVVVLGDGADWIWRYAWQFLGRTGVEVIEIVDVFHAWGHLWTVANAVFGAGTARAAAWVAPLKGDLLDTGPAPILAALAALAPAASDAAGDTDLDANAAEEIRKAIGYFTEHATRMDYPRFVARQLPIGSGGVESACKTLIQAREKQAGMRWSRAGAQVVASLRAVHRSGRWDAFWQTHPQRRRPPIVPRPPASASAPHPDTRAA